MFCPLELGGFSMKTDQPRWGCYGWVALRQGWRVKRAYPVYDVKRENKAVGLGLFKPLK